MKKKEKRTPPGERTAANRRKSEPCPETKPENRELGSRTDSLLPNNPDLDQHPVGTDAGKLRARPAAPITSSERPLKVRNGTLDGGESSRIQTFGTSDFDLYSRLFLQVTTTMPPLVRGDHNYVLSALQGIGPKDALEGQLAADMVAVNAAAMHFLALGMTQGQPFEAVEPYVNCANKLFRTYTALMEALNRHRGKIGPPVVVGNVNVNDGGQAIVGSVQRSGSESTSKNNEEKKVG